MRNATKRSCPWQLAPLSRLQWQGPSASRVGDTFDAIVTGASPKGTYVRLLTPPVEGRVMAGEQGLDVGDRVRVTLRSTDPTRGFVDFGVAK